MPGLRGAVRSWLSDHRIRKIGKNAGVLLAGNLASSGLNLLSLVLAARALGPWRFGVLVLARTYVSVVNYLLNFQSWQALVRYGAEAIEEERADDFRRLVKLCFLVDAGTAVLSAVVSASAAYFVADQMGWSSRVGDLAIAYAVVVVFNVAGMPTAVLRLFDRYRVFAVVNTISATVILGIATFGYLTDGGLYLYISAWIVGEIVGSVLLFGAADRELRAQGYGGWLSMNVRNAGRRFRGLWRFLLTTNAQSSVIMGVKQLDVILVGRIAGEAGAGLYKIARQFATIGGKLFDPLYQVIYPELVRHAVARDWSGLQSLVLRLCAATAVGASVLWIGVLVFGELALEISVGASYLEALPVLHWYMLGMVVGLAAVPLHRSLLALGRPGLWFSVSVTCAIGYVVAISPLVTRWGPVGAARAFLGYQLVYALGLAILTFRFLSNLRRTES